MNMKTVLSVCVGLSLLFAPACDDGKIYDEHTSVVREGGAVNLTGHLHGVDSWPGGYSIVLAGFAGTNEYAQTAQGITPETDGSVSMTLQGIPAEVTRVEVCAINKLRKRIATFCSVDYEETADTLRLDMGTVDARMYAAIQSGVFDRSCTACHGGSTKPAAGLYLTEGKSHAALVGIVADRSADSLLLVNPGNASESFLHVMLRENVLRYDHTQIITSANTLQLIDDWIDNGANE